MPFCRRRGNLRRAGNPVRERPRAVEPGSVADQTADLGRSDRNFWVRRAARFLQLAGAPRRTGGGRRTGTLADRLGPIPPGLRGRSASAMSNRRQQRVCHATCGQMLQRTRSSAVRSGTPGPTAVRLPHRQPHGGVYGQNGAGAHTSPPTDHQAGRDGTPG
ncbi:JM166 [macacine gammaherpesvirus 11]|uniref:JM166 n=2 Tax=macacine gammaherpesvirus 11 TaxID=2560570 RepID=G9JMH3_9GAMA|nr:JM166 [Macaca fuscata rhadinovirus]AAT00143.1 JM166 [Macaca fuscata rhadinovirus]AEW87690.1 JM166 [Macaca fuscata rhadinovirus]AEW87860.1 JM166 [Macaca fuscata rhadinovirus]